MTASLNTVRYRIREQDNRSGEYPTISRTGDLRKGNLPVFFNDRDTIFFTENTPVYYPTLLPYSSSYHITQSVNLTNDGLRNSLITRGTVRKGVSDALFVPSITEEQYSPYVEDNLYAITSASFEDPFFKTGSKIEDVGLGFSTPVRSKTKIVIDLSPTTASRFGYEQVYSNNQINFFPTSYFNFSDRKWEKVGTGSIGGLIGSINKTLNTQLLHPLGFSRGSELMLTSSHLNCLPVSNFGFPHHPKFHATSSQAYDMSSVISHPFLLEKFVYEFEAALESDEDAQSYIYNKGDITNESIGHNAFISTFFMMNQRRPFNSNILIPTTTLFTTFLSGTNITSSVPSMQKISMGGPQEYIDTTRDLITFGQLVSYSSSQGGGNTPGQFPTIKTILKSGLGRELNFKSSTSGGAFSRTKFIMSGTVKEALRLNRTFGYSMLTVEHGASGDMIFFMENTPGARDNLEVSITGRDLVAAQPAGAPSDRNINDKYGLLNGLEVLNVQFQEPVSAPVVNSPYLLLPTDKLVFGWQVPALYSHRPSQTARGPRLEIFPGSGKLTLYGSLIKEGQEYHETLNQALTSNAIHEDIHNENPTLDQWDVEIRQQFSGSFIDNIITGTMNDVRGQSGRGVIGSNVGSTSINVASEARKSKQQVPGFEQKGLFRGVQCIDSSERYYDTLLPRFDEIARVNGAKVVLVPSSASNLAAVAMHSEKSIYGIHMKKWSTGFPYESRYSTLNRNLNPATGWSADVNFNDEVVISSRSVKRCTVMLRADASGRPSIFYDSINNVTESAPLESDVIKHAYGIGDYFRSSSITSTNLSEYGVPNFRSPENFGAVIRGWKYGIHNGLPENSKAIFRREKYGLFRDMLEQRQNTAFYNIDTKDLTKSPIFAQFLSSSKIIKPFSSSISSNMSQNCTASMPYFDGMVKNR